VTPGLAHVINRLLLGIGLAAALLPRIAVADPACPENQIVLSLATGITVSATSTAAALDTSASYARGSYDLDTGLLASSVSFYDPGSVAPRWAGSSVDIEDDYRVIGLSAGTPVDFTAEITVGGSWNVYPGVPQGEFSAEAWVSVDRDTARFSVPLPGGCCHGALSPVLSLPLQRGAETPFRLRVHLASQNYRGRVDETAQLRFVGLPAGVSVVSCHSEPLVPVRPGSWGRLKVHYR
jgi:hypothetical protein